jgi:PAS domain S-box-containing protein
VSCLCCGGGQDVKSEVALQELIGQRPPANVTAGAVRCGIFAVDDDGVIRAWNRGAADLLGWSEDLAVGRRLGEILVPPAFLGVEAGDRSIVPSALTGDRTWTVAVRRRDGTEATVLLDVATVEADGRRLLVGLIRPADASFRPAAPAADLLQILFERAPETITITDAEGRQRLVNSAGLRMLQFDPALRTPPDGIDFVHPSDRERLAEHRLELLRLVAEHGSAAELPAIRYRIRNGAGQWRWLESLFADMTDIPEVAGRVAFSRDVTEAEERAQALLESEARLRALVASFPGGAFLSDGAGRVLLANETLKGLFPGTPPTGEVTGMDLARVIACLSESVAQPSVLPAAGNGTAPGSWHAELELRGGRVVDAEAIPIDGPDAHLGRLWLFRDATERRDRARQQERLLELEQAARQAAEAQTEQLQAYDKLRNDFVSSVSHALRTPLASISSAAQLLLSQEAPASTTTRSYLEIIDRNAERLHQMVENLLLARRLDAGMLALDLAQVRVDGVIEEVAARLRPVALQRRVRIVVRSAALTATADRERLADIVENLAGNAVKYTRPGTDVTVTASAAPGGWMISVADHGPGIPPGQRRAVFGLFVRAADAERDGTQGSGLGLAITKGLVELHGGAIEVGDAPGGGAVFSCWFPAERPGS